LRWIIVIGIAGARNDASAQAVNRSAGARVPAGHEEPPVIRRHRDHTEN
jgi:hypothetical protein